MENKDVKVNEKTLDSEVTVLKELYGLTEKEISNIYNIPISQVQLILNKANV